MRLFLSSIRLPNRDEQASLFAGKSDLSVAIVPNAWDIYPQERQASELAGTISQFRKSGFRTSVLNLATDSLKNVEVCLASSDLIWIMGGNTFYLNYLVRKTNFEEPLRNALGNGLVYGGASAGTVIATPTLRGADNVDDPKAAPEVIWDGLGLVDFGIVPHWGTEKYAAALEKMKDELGQYVPNIVTLTDDQAATIIDGQVDVVCA